MNNEIDSDLFFGLSHASFLVLPRIALQSMSTEWQHKFFALVDELENTIVFPDGYISEYAVTAKHNNKFAKHGLPHYRHNYLPRKETYVKTN
jgi:hypothetical protein